MKIYLLSQDRNSWYDTYDSCVVCAESEEEARTIHPSEFVTHYRDGKWYWTYSNDCTDIQSRWKEYEKDTNYGSWIPAKYIDVIKVQEIWEANENQKKWVICSSFNAG